MTTIYQLPFEVTSVEYSTQYKNICCAATFDYNHWYHNGNLHLLHVNTRNDSEISIEQLTYFDNKIGIHDITFSEYYVDSMCTANHDGTLSFWNINEGKHLANVLAEKGHEISAVSWNNLIKEYILCASTSSRIKLFDTTNLEYILETFAEHTKKVCDVNWNNNNMNEFATVSLDGLLKIWDRRMKESVNTLLDRKEGCALLCCDWHKRDDWLIAVGNSRNQVVIWDTRNDLQPLKRRFVHRDAVTCVKFDTVKPDRLATCSKDRMVRIFDTKDGILLTHEHKIHTSGVYSIDWDIHNPNIITSAGHDKTVITSLLSDMIQVTEYMKSGELMTEKKVKPPNVKRIKSKL